MASTLPPDFDFTLVMNDLVNGDNMLMDLIKAYHNGNSLVKRLLKEQMRLRTECRYCGNSFVNLNLFLTHKMHFCKEMAGNVQASRLSCPDPRAHGQQAAEEEEPQYVPMEGRRDVLMLEPEMQERIDYIKLKSGQTRSNGEAGAKTDRGQTQHVSRAELVVLNSRSEGTKEVAVPPPKTQSPPPKPQTTQAQLPKAGVAMRSRKPPVRLPSRLHVITERLAAKASSGLETECVDEEMAEKSSGSDTPCEGLGADNQTLAREKNSVAPAAEHTTWVGDSAATQKTRTSTREKKTPKWMLDHKRDAGVKVPPANRKRPASTGSEKKEGEASSTKRCRQARTDDQHSSAKPANMGSSHVKAMKMQKFRCSVCQKDLANKKSLNFHVQHQHVEKKKKSHCHLCSRSYDYPWGLKRHLQNKHCLSVGPSGAGPFNGGPSGASGKTSEAGDADQTQRSSTAESRDTSPASSAGSPSLASTESLRAVVNRRGRKVHRPSTNPANWSKQAANMDDLPAGSLMVKFKEALPTTQIEHFTLQPGHKQLEVIWMDKQPGKPSEKVNSQKYLFVPEDPQPKGPGTGEVDKIINSKGDKRVPSRQSSPAGRPGIGPDNGSASSSSSLPTSTITSPIVSTPASETPTSSDNQHHSL